MKNKYLAKLLFFYFPILLVIPAGMLAWLLIHSEPKTQYVKVLESVEVLQMPYPKNYEQISNPVIETLNENDQALYLSSVTEKDFVAYKIKLSDDRVGYIIQSEKIKIINKSQ